MNQILHFLQIFLDNACWREILHLEVYCEYIVTNIPTFLHSYTVQRERDELVEANNSLRKMVAEIQR